MGALLKYLLLALLVLWLLYSPAVRGRLRGSLPKRPKDTPKSTAEPAPPPDRIVPCAHCGVHLPLADARLDVGGRTYCTDAHRLAGPRS